MLHESQINQAQSALVNKGQAAIHQNQFANARSNFEIPTSEEFVAEPHLQDEHLNDNNGDEMVK